MAFVVRDDHPECDGFAVVDEAEPDTMIGDCQPSEEQAQAIADEMNARADNPKPKPDAPAPKPKPGAPPRPGAAGVAWRGVLAMDDARTQDDRRYTVLDVRSGPLPLALQDAAQHAMVPDGGLVAGRIERTEHVGRAWLGWGTFDETDAGRRAAELLSSGRFGVSVDLADLDADVSWECQAEGTVEDPFFGEEIQACVDMVMVFPFARIAGATMTPIPAFEEAFVELDDGTDPTGWATEASAAADSLNAAREAERVARLEGRGRAIVASAIPTVPPLAWFERPPASDPGVPLTITPEGQVYGWLGVWDECHIGLSGCVNPPRSASNYALFHTGTVEVATPAGDLVRLRAGRITYRTTHAGDYDDARAAVAHYEHTGRVAADVVATDTPIGIWLCGALRPGLDAAEYREILAAPPSGDWRPIGPDDELVAVTLVNTPGFMGAHRSFARAVTAGGSIVNGHVHPGRRTALIRLAHGYPKPRPNVGALLRRIDALERRLDDLWEAGGRAAVWERLAASLDHPVPEATPHSCGCGTQVCSCEHA